MVDDGGDITAGGRSAGWTAGEGVVSTGKGWGCVGLGLVVDTIAGDDKASVVVDGDDDGSCGPVWLLLLLLLLTS